jgi:ribosomal protein S18 acetylase RimI-like enzyme
VKVVVRPMEARDLGECASIACDSEIGERYGFVAATMEGGLSRATAGGGAELFVAESQGTLLGFAWVEPRGAFCMAPYLKLIAVRRQERGRGVGAALLAEFERRTAAVGRDYCLLVSDFNMRAIAFYEKHGYTRRGELPDFAVRGIAEILMVKQVAPGARSGAD